MKCVSVVIPARNAAATIAGTLSSLHSEADLIGEVLLVDDASCDGTVDAARQAAAQLRLPLRVLRASFGNAGEARNMALAEAVSPWIYLLDADDLHLELGLRSMLSAAGSKAGADMVIGSYVRRVNGQDRGSKSPGRYASDGLANAVNYLEGRVRSIAIGSALVARRAIGNIRFPAGLGYDEDTLFWARVLSKAAPIKIARPVMVYVVSSERSDDRFTFKPVPRFLAWRRELRGLADCGIPKSAIKRREGLVALKIARVHFARGDLVTAARFLAIASAAPKSPADVWRCMRYRLRIAARQRLAARQAELQRA
jgi:glycosyltransferase involved in cell wall biosynthesis